MHSIQFTGQMNCCIVYKSKHPEEWFKGGPGVGGHPSCPFRYQKTKQAISERTGSWKTSPRNTNETSFTYRIFRTIITILGLEFYRTVKPQVK